MRVAIALARAGFRKRLAGLAALALVVAIGLGISLAALEAANRTERAYPDYLREADVGELVINPSLATARADEIIASTPGVAGHVSDDFMTVTFDDGEPRTQSAIDSGSVQGRVSANGRYISQDRPIVHEGRMIEGGEEAFVSREVADAFGIAVGDDIPLSFWSASYNTEPAATGELVDPLGTERVRVVGIGVFADEVVVDELYPRHRALVTADLAEPYTCTFGTPQEGDPRSLEEMGPELIPADCALAYRYYSLQLEQGDSGVGAVSDALLAAFEEENAVLPPAMQEADIGYFVIPSATRDERAQLARSLDPAVTALRLFGLAVGASTVVVAVLGAARVARRDQQDARTWSHLGVTRGQRLLAASAPLLVGAATGLVGAAAIGWLASGLGPVASARAVDPGGELHLSGRESALVLGGGSVALALGLLVVAATASRARTTPRVARVPWLARATTLSAPPTRGLGIRAATVGAGAGAVVLGSITAVAVVLATVTFSTSLGGLIAQPDRYGWPYDAAAMVGFGYGGLDEEAVATSLDRPEVESWGVASLGPVLLEGDNVPTVAAAAGFDSVPLPIIEGTLPTEDDELALGAQTAEELGLEIGDEVDVASDYGAGAGRVTGTVVLPSLGPFESDRAATGTGALLSDKFFDELIEQAEVAADLEPGTLRIGLNAFVGIDLRDDVDSVEFFAEIDEELLAWDSSGYEPFRYPQPVRPAQIADVAAMRRVPVALGGFFALAMALGLALGIAAATRGRRRELALLRAIGCSGRQIRASVRWHALTVVGVALLVGAPVGIAVGRTLYRSFARDLGVVDTPLVSVPWTAGVLLATVVVGLLAAAAPARRSAREASATVLRNE